MPIGPATPDNLALDNALFEETMTVEDSEREYGLLKEREENGLEEVLPEAKKSNKHYRPFGEVSNVSQHRRQALTRLRKAQKLRARAQALRAKPTPRTQATTTAHIQGHHRQVVGDVQRGQGAGKEQPRRWTFELAVNLRHICGFDRELMDKVIPCYDNFQAQKMKCIDSALAEKRTQMPKRLKDVLLR